jgi:Fe-S oxidoreductase
VLSTADKIFYVLIALTSVGFAVVTFTRMVRVILRGQGRLFAAPFVRRAGEGFAAFLSQGGMMLRRPVTSAFHAIIVLGFLYYLLANVGDLAEGFLPGFRFLADSQLGGPYRIVGDFLSAGVIVAMAFFLVRRFLTRSTDLSFPVQVQLHPQAERGIKTDSFLVGVFILGHVGSRFLGATFSLSLTGADVWQPIASIVAASWVGLSATSLEVGERICWWVSQGLILAFIPYFPYSKHAHLFMGPLNYFTRPERPSPGALDVIDFDAEGVEQFGASRLTNLSRTQIVDAFACVMCNRCQDVCPATATGKTLSPAALEINKRYHIGGNLSAFAAGAEDRTELLDFALDESAVWSCLGCGACSQVCPVGNEPMLDIMDIRRDQVLMKGKFPAELRSSYDGMQGQGNPWNLGADRLAWTEPLDFAVPTVEDNPDFEMLYWVGCAGAFDPLAGGVARATASILNAAGVNYAVLGNKESCSGDLARRSGNEYLFSEIAQRNVEVLNSVLDESKSVMTGCPHCLHVLKNEYTPFGGKYEVQHHSQVIRRLIDDGSIEMKSSVEATVTFHDPCYLGRQNGEYEAPRDLLSSAGTELVEMDRVKENSFCCGGGGAQAWKEEEAGTQAVNSARFEEASTTKADTVAVGCPFCLKMLSDAGAKDGSEMEVEDVAEIVAKAIAG